MRILLDENLPVAGRGVDRSRSRHRYRLGWHGIKNSELLRHAQGHFDALITMESNLEFQQNIAGIGLAVLVVAAPSNRMVHLRPLVPAILAALKTTQPGQVRRVGP